MLLKKENDSGLHQGPFLKVLRWHAGEDATCETRGWDLTAFSSDSTSNEERSDEALALSAWRGQAWDSHPGDMLGLRDCTAQSKPLPSSPPASPINNEDGPGRGKEKKGYSHDWLQDLYLNIFPLRKEISSLHNWFILAFWQKQKHSHWKKDKSFNPPHFPLVQQNSQRNKVLWKLKDIGKSYVPIARAIHIMGKQLQIQCDDWIIHGKFQTLSRNKVLSWQQTLPEK